MIDDSELLHGTYDPAYARAYYLRTRKLKGRRPAAAPVKKNGRSNKLETKAIGVGVSGKPNRSKTKSRQAELRAQKEALEKRLDRLREELKKLVVAAKARSGVKKPEPKDAAPETSVDKADRNKAEKKSKPETASEKKERAKKAKEAYEKEHPNTLSQDVEILQAQIEDIQAKIEKALSSARERRNKAGAKELRSGLLTTNDGPKGR